jgi:hypothetical protein
MTVQKVKVDPKPMHHSKLGKMAVCRDARRPIQLETGINAEPAVENHLICDSLNPPVLHHFS